jgi:hypothetical protein
MLVRFRPRLVHVFCMLSPLLVAACGGDDDKNQTPPTEDENEGGAPALPPSYPPALGPEDCVGTISSLNLVQPDRAGVWGGLVVLEFTAEGEKLDSFDVQAYDPALGAWTNYYVSVQTLGQRDDGSYFLAVSPYFSEATKGEQIKLRVRPAQQGCPDAAWTESEPFTATDPLLGTKWRADLPSGSVTGQLLLQRSSIPMGMPLPDSRLSFGDATIELAFGKKGVFTETVSLPISTAKDVAWDGCTLGLTFSGTYSLQLRQQYGGLSLTISDQVLTSYEATQCDSPTVEQMSFTAADAQPFLNAITQQVSINYLPTLYQKPGMPTWQNSNLAQIFQQLPQFLAYVTKTETGLASGYAYPQDLTFTQE